jgi:hypothetical protein
MKKVYLAFAFSALTLCFTACGSNSSQHDDHSATSGEHAEKYACPMHCEGDKTYDAPGKCPVCGMDLQPVQAEAPAMPADSSGMEHDSTQSV